MPKPDGLRFFDDLCEEEPLRGHLERAKDVKARVVSMLYVENCHHCGKGHELDPTRYEIFGNPVAYICEDVLVKATLTQDD